MRRLILASFLILLPRSSHAFLGTELAPLLQLVAGQVREIEQLTKQVGLAQEQRQYLIQLNEGIDRTVRQIESIQAIIDRSQGLDPRAIRSLADLNDYLSRVQDAKHSVEEILNLKIQAASIAVGQTAAQSDTAYKMGQEMISTGSQLAQESTTASPGRASQIAAASSSAQMLGQGVELQTLAQIAQLQAMTLELQKAQMEQLLAERKTSRSFFRQQLAQSRRTRP